MIAVPTLERTVDTGAKSRREIWAEESRKLERKGNLLFSTSSFKTAYEEHFDISKMATGQLTAGVSFKGWEWSANLKPKTPFPIPCLIEAVFPVSASSQQIEASLTPVELKDGFRAALAHPYVSEMRMREKVTELRLRSLGDRLHWSHPKHTGWLAGTTGIAYPDSDPLREWAYFILD